MRFAYIDSQGKEVGIPSVEALQLRIELGAIVDGTMFYDANADKWAPAAEHEIYRTLQRDLEGGDEISFVAPLPPTIDTPAPAAPVDVVPATPEVAEAVPVEVDGAEEPPVVAPEEPVAADPPAEDAAEPEPDAELELGSELTFVDTAMADGPEDAGGDDEQAAEPDFSDFSFEPSPVPEAEGDVQTEEETATEDDGPGAFDFGDFGTIELEEQPEDEEEDEGTGSELDIEQPFAEQDFGAGADIEPGGLELERPMSEYTPDSPPGWMDEEPERPSAPAPASEPEPAHAHGPTSGEGERGADDEEAAAPAEAPQPRGRPRPPPLPRRRSSRGAGKLVGGLLAVAVLGGGGWFGWTRFASGPAEAPDPGPAFEEVEIPVIPPELEGTYRQHAAAAFSDLLGMITEAKNQATLPVEPHEDWLAGVYLANASDYAQVEAYWQAVSAFLADVRAREHEMFMEAFEARLEAAGVPEDDRAVLRERASAGFRSALGERAPAYGSLATVVQASLNFHQFLLEHEDDIDYDPAAGGISRDPVLEAVPLTEELGDEMWERFGTIANALEDMGGLRDRVNTDRLVSLMIATLGTATVH